MLLEEEACDFDGEEGSEKFNTPFKPCAVDPRAQGRQNMCRYWLLLLPEFDRRGLMNDDPPMCCMGAEGFITLIPSASNFVQELGHAWVDVLKVTLPAF